MRYSISIDSCEEATQCKYNSIYKTYGPKNEFVCIGKQIAKHEHAEQCQFRVKSTTHFNFCVTDKIACVGRLTLFKNPLGVCVVVVVYTPCTRFDEISEARNQYFYLVFFCVYSPLNTRPNNIERADVFR